MSYFTPRPFAVTAPAPAGVILAASAFRAGLRMLAAELVETNAAYLRAQLNANPDHCGNSLVNVAIFVERAQSDVGRQYFSVAQDQE